MKLLQSNIEVVFKHINIVLEVEALENKLVNCLQISVIFDFFLSGIN